MSSLRLAMHPASEGDALILSWGAGAQPRRALFDLGRTKDYRALKPLLAELGALDLFVLSHIDADHIEGAVAMFKDAALPFKANAVWFNAHLQLEKANERLPPTDRVVLGAKQAEKVTEGLVATKWPWNSHFASGIVSIDSEEARAPIALDGGLTLTLLSPSDRKLAKLAPVWDKELAKAGLRTTDPDAVADAVASGRVRLGRLDVETLAAAPFKADGTAPNGSSIALIAEHDGKRVLMGADAHADLVEDSLRKLGASEARPYRIDCLKMSHHGSRANTSPTLLKLIDCTRFAFSTDGSRHDHPDPETIARILKNDPTRQKTLIFNFRQEQTEQWEDAALMRRWNYECRFPKAGKDGVEFDI